MKYIVGAILGILILIWGFFAYDPLTSIVLQNLSSNATATIPPNYYLHDIVLENTNANAVTGGIKIGTTSGGTDVVLGQSVAANSYATVGTSVLKKIFSSSSSTTVYVQAVTAWNSANVNVYFVLTKMK